MNTRHLVAGALLLAALTTSGASQAQSPKDKATSFADLWKLHQKGEDVREALATLYEDRQQQTKARFNAAYLLAIIQLAHGDTDLASNSLDKADSVKANTPQVAVRRAEIQLLKHEPKQARSLLEKSGASLRKNKRSALYLRHEILRARVESQLGKHKVAQRILKAVQKLNKNDWEPAFFRGRIYEKTDSPDEALEQYEKAIEHLPKTDPCIGIYALQRWAALSISSDGSSYSKPKVIEKAKQRYKTFLARAKANHVPQALVANVKQAMSVLDYFAKKR